MDHPGEQSLWVFSYCLSVSSQPTLPDPCQPLIQAAASLEKPDQNDEPLTAQKSQSHRQAGLPMRPMHPKPATSQTEQRASPDA